MRKIDLAYCAGVIDSDGTIGIKKSTYGIRVIKTSTQATYSERVCVKQVESGAVDLLHSLFGGYRFRAAASAKKGKPLEGWQVTDVKAVTCLRALLPFLRIKQAQARNCLELRVAKEMSKRQRVAKNRGHVGAAHRHPDISAKMESLCERAHLLNRVGV